MPDLRELFDNPEEAFRVAWDSLQKRLHTSMVAQVTEASDGKTVQAVPTIKQQLVDPTLTETTYQDFPILPDVPVHFPGGNGVTLTHGIAAGDEMLAIFASRPLDTWFTSGGTQQPIADRVHSLSDAVAIPGVRSKPRELKQISTTAAHLRSDDKRHLHELDPQKGITHFSADPATAPASDTFDPLTQATTFYKHVVQAAAGILGQAVSPGSVHSHGVAHDVGAFMTALNGLHSVLAHPQNGASLNALNGLHQVLAHPSIGAALMGNNGASSVIATASLALQSATGISLSCPAGGLSLPVGGVGGSSLGAGAASQNVGALSGDLSGNLPNPTVVGILNVANANLLPIAANDAAAATLTPPVPVGGLYRSGSQLMVRVA